ncbi:ABC transporter ATP-binding protein [Candidatus Peregrinibacteria bacterium]|nr:ABC transporter ATP-binding protein [Candidatus Peregrinibacteria bacterium]
MQDFTIIKRIFRLLKLVNVHPAYLGIPISLSIVSAVFEGVSVGLLIPLINGFLSKDFSFIKEVPVLGTVLTYFPIQWTTTDRSLFAVLLVIFIVATLFKNVLKYLSVVSMYFFADRSFHHLRKTLFNRYLTFGKLFFDRTSIGHHATVLSDFSYRALHPVMQCTKYINAFFALIVYLVVMSAISWQLTAFALPLFAVLHVCVRTLIARLQGLSRSIAERSKELSKRTIETLSLIPLVKASNTQFIEQARYTALSNKKAMLDFRVNAVEQFILPFQEIVTLLSAAILFAGMLYLMVRQDAAAAPSFIVYFYLVLNASAKFGALTGFRVTLAVSEGPAREVWAVFDDSDKNFVESGKRAFTGLKDTIEFRDLSFSYPGERHVLTGVSFAISKGNMTAIVGPTGAGKTTLINLIMRYYDCKPGELLIDGTDIRSFSIGSLMEKMALVSQDTMLLNETLRHNMTYGLDGIAEEELWSAVRRARLQEFIGKLPLGLDTLIGDRGVQLSGGEKQRVSIARALLKKAEILILDEATSSLDSRTEKLIQEAIDEATRDRTAVVIAHRLSTIKHADKIVVLDKGHKAEEGTLDALLAKKGVFFGLWQEQKF